MPAAVFESQPQMQRRQNATWQRGQNALRLAMSQSPENAQSTTG